MHISVLDCTASGGGWNPQSLRLCAGGWMESYLRLCVGMDSWRMKYCFFCVAMLVVSAMLSLLEAVCAGCVSTGRWFEVFFRFRKCGISLYQ